jgi:ribonuclease HII
LAAYSAQRIAGIDEVGRGCLVGPVIAAAVILNPQAPIAGLADSKKLSAKRRDNIAETIKANAMAWAIGRAEASEIDQLNILQASLLAMRRAFNSLPVQPDWVSVDGIHFPDISCPGETVVKGDARVAEISAASILAKVTRDNEMLILDKIYPGYQFSRHKGYPTTLHLQCLAMLGVTASHRKTFSPVAKILQGQ